MKRLASLCLILAAFAAASQNLPNRRTAGAVTLTNNNYYLDGGEIHQGDDAGLKNLVVTGTCTGCGGGGSTSDSGTAGTADAGLTVDYRDSDNGHFVNKITMGYRALWDHPGLDPTVTLWTVPAQTKIVRMVASVTEPFAGVDGGAGKWTDATFQCGPAGALTAYLATAYVDADGGSSFILGDVEAELGTRLAGLQGDIPSWTGTTAIQCKVSANCQFPCPGGQAGFATAGSADIWIEGQVFP